MLAQLLIICATIWQVLNWSSDYVPTDAPGQVSDLATFQFPTNIGYTPFVAFLVTTQDCIGNLTRRTITCTLTVETDADPTFVFGGHDNWNWGQLPPNTRFFISSETGYSKEQYDSCQTCFWFCDNVWTEIGTNTSTVTLSATLDPRYWSDAGGNIASERLNEFAGVVSHCSQIGLAFGGGDFFDVGIALMNVGGSATFHLNSFDVVANLSEKGKVRTNDD